MDAPAKAKFLELLRETLNVTTSAKGAGYSRWTAYRERERDPAFAEAWDNAAEEAYDQLEQEARRRAFMGVDEPVFHRGEIVGHKRVYSDSLVMPLLGTYRRQFRPQTSLELTGKDGGPVQLDEGAAAARVAALMALAQARKASEDDLIGE